MSFLNPKQCTDEDILAFWAWFAANEEKMTQKEGTKRAQLLREAERRMQPLFPELRGTVDLALMPSGERWELNLYYGNRPYIRRMARRIRVLMPVSLQGKWRMEVQK